MIEELLLDSIRKITAEAREHESEFVDMVMKKTRAEMDRTLRDERRELEQANARISKLDEIIRKLYEDNLEGKISDERFMKLNETYEKEQKTLEARVSKLRSAIACEQEANVNINRFLALVRKYTEPKELTAEMIRELVERIDVYQAEEVAGKRSQRIRIVWNCIGEMPMLEQNAKTA